MIVDVQAAGSVRAEREGAGVGRNRQVGEASRSIRELGAVDHAVKDDGFGRLDVAMVAHVAAAVVAEGGLVGVDQGTLFGEDSAGIGDDGFGAGQTGDGGKGLGQVIGGLFGGIFLGIRRLGMFLGIGRLSLLRLGCGGQKQQDDHASDDWFIDGAHIFSSLCVGQNRRCTFHN